MTHSAQWFKRSDGKYYAVCTCGWRSRVGSTKDYVWTLLRLHERES